MCENPDRVLLERAKEGAQRELGELLKRHGPPLRQRMDINVKWRSVLEPDDVMQATYLEAAMDIQSFTGSPEQFSGWLWTIAQNNLRDAITELERKKRPHPDKRVEPSTGSDPLLDLYQAMTAGATTPSGRFARNEIIAILNSEIETLPEDYGKILRLHYFQDLPFKAVAKEMGRTYGAVVLLHHRARARLAQRLGSPSRFFSK